MKVEVGISLFFSFTTASYLTYYWVDDFFCDCDGTLVMRITQTLVASLYPHAT